jgi:hypothetical protein
VPFGGFVSKKKRVITAAVVVLAGSSLYYVTARNAERLEPIDIRQALFDELKPVTLKNCTLKRYGGPGDGGYLMCENLIQGAASAYSYGIETEDDWGCQLSRTFGVMIHQYDCFTEDRPACDGGRTTFHDECVGPQAETINDNLFDTVPGQVVKNGDRGKRIIVKMDVEGAEWDSLLATPDDVLANIDQMPMELHGTDEARFLQLVRKLKKQFHLVNLHFNNYACTPWVAPFPAVAYQVLWVNKRLSDVDRTAPVPAPLSPANAPDNPKGPDCQLQK